MRIRVKNEKSINEEDLYHLYHNEGLSQREIADYYNCSRGKVRYRMDKWDIESRSIKSAIHKKFPRIETKCPVCGEEVSKPKSVIKDGQQAIYCSQECAYEGRGEYTKRRVKGGYETQPTKVEKICEQCGEDFVVEKTNDGYKYCSRDCFHKSHSERMLGENNPAYTNGSSKEKRGYRGENWEEQRKKCYERDNYTCQKCGRNCVSRKSLSEDNSDRLIQCHHINPYSQGGSNQLSNLITLCVKCHTKMHN